MQNFRDIFCRNAGFDYVNRYITGLILSPNKTMQGIHNLQVWDDKKPKYRTMYEAVCEVGWDSNQLMPRHRKIQSQKYQNKGRHIISLDWTFGHHERGPKIYGVKKGYDYVNKRYSNFQTIITAVLSNSQRVDCIDVEIQKPGFIKEEKAYLETTVKNEYEQLEQARERILELLNHHLHVKSYKKRTEIFVEQVKKLEEEGLFPEANYAFDNRVLHLELVRLIESYDKHWVSELEISRNVLWQGKWKRIDEVSQSLKDNSAKSFRHHNVKLRTGNFQDYWVFSKVFRLKRGYGKKRILIVHEQANLEDTPRFLVTDALHWESKRILNVWSYRWSSEIFHEFAKQCTGFESAQLRGEEGVKRHLRMSCIAQSILQEMTFAFSTSEKFSFAKGQSTLGQKWRFILRDIFHGLLIKVKSFIKKGRSISDIMDTLMPA